MDVISMFNFPKPDLNEFLHAFDINLFCVSEDERHIAMSTNLTGEYEVWMLDLPSAYPYPLTSFGQKVHRLYFDPLCRHLLAAFDEDGNEKAQLYAIGMNGGKPIPIIHTENAAYHLQAISLDGNHIYYATDRDNRRYMNSYRRNLMTGEEEVIHKGEETLTFIMSVSPDETSFTYNKAYSNTDIQGYVRKDGQDFNLIPHSDTPHRARSHRYYRNDTIFFWTDYLKEYSYVGKFDICTREFKEVFSVNGEDVIDLQIDNTNDRMYVFTSGGVQDFLYSLNLKDSSSKRIPLPVSIIHQSQVIMNGNLYICGVSETMPSNVFKYDLLKEDWKQITGNRIIGASSNHFVQSEMITYKSYDGLEIEALMYEPKTSNGYTIIWPHGGPQSAVRKNYQGMIQFFCSRGYKFFAPNFRGSTGYGKSFMKKVERNWGEGPRLDIVEGIEWLISSGKSERGKLFLMGKSFGGYMSLLLHARHGEYFKAIVDMYGETDLISFIESVPESWKPLMERRLGDVNNENDRSRLIADSPLTYTENMTKPMLIIHGANDTRVLKQQSDKLVEELRRKNRDVEYIVFDNEGHGFSKKENEIYVYQRIADFFEKHIE